MRSRGRLFRRIGLLHILDRLDALVFQLDSLVDRFVADVRGLVFDLVHGRLLGGHERMPIPLAQAIFA